MDPSPDLRQEQAWLTTGSLVVLAMVAIAFVLHFIQTIMVPFVLAVFIASMTSPVLDALMLKARLSRTLSVVITLLLVLAVVAGLCLLVVLATQQIQQALYGARFFSVSQAPATPVRSEASIAAQEAGEEALDTVRLVQWKLFGAEMAFEASQQARQARIESGYIAQLSHLTDRMLTYLEERGMKIEKRKIITELNNLVPSFVSSIVLTAMNVVSLTFFVAIFLVFIIAGRDPHTVRSGLYAQLDSKIRAYLVTKFMLSAATGMLVWLSLWLLGLQLAGVFGLLAFLLNFIPSIGSVVATMLPLPMAFAQFGDNWWMIAVVILVPGAIQMTIGNAVEPKLMGKGMQLHPITVIAMLAFWGILWGPIGMLLAVPITAIIRIIFMHFETLRPAGNLMAGILPEPSATGREATG